MPYCVGEELTHWNRPWCWERLRAGGEGDDRGWDGWMASPTQKKVKDREACCAAVHGVSKSWTWLSNWTEKNTLPLWSGNGIPSSSVIAATTDCVLCSFQIDNQAIISSWKQSSVNHINMVTALEKLWEPLNAA